MMIGPAPMMRMVEMSVRFGMGPLGLTPPATRRRGIQTHKKGRAALATDREASFLDSRAPGRSPARPGGKPLGARPPGGSPNRKSGLAEERSNTRLESGREPS